MGALGGQLQQLYYVVNAIIKLFPNDSDLQSYYNKLAEDPKQEAVKHPNTPRELLLENFFVPFLLTSIKELKCDHMQLLITPQLDALISTFKLPKTSSDLIDFARMNNEQYIAFRHAFVEERLYNETYRKNKGHKAMDLILSVLCQVLCNRVPKGIVSFRTESLAQKIRMVHVPRGVEVVTRTAMERVPPSAENPKGGEQEVVIEKNTNEKAVVRILVPKRTMTLSEYKADRKNEKGEADDEEADSPDKTGEEEKKSTGDAHATPERNKTKTPDGAQERTGS